MNGNLLKGLGVVGTVVGIGASLLSGFVGKKQQEATIKNEVAKAVAEQLSKKES